MIEIHHIQNQSTQDCPSAYGEPEAVCDAFLQYFNAGHYNKVASIATNDLDTAYELSNNIHQSWILNPGVTPSDAVKTRGGCRSTSVGDVFVTEDNQKHLVAPFGFILLAGESGHAQ